MRPEHRVQRDRLGTVRPIGARQDIEPAQAVLRHPRLQHVGVLGAEVLRVLDVGLHHHRDPRIDRRFEPHAGEARRRHADDGEVDAVEGDVAADRIGGGVEAAAPERVADHRDRMPAERAIVVGRQQAAELRRAARSTPKNSPETSCTLALCGSPPSLQAHARRRGSSPPGRSASGSRRAAARRTDTRRAA